METRGVRGGNSPAAFASSTCATPMTSRSAADGYSWLFSPKGTGAPGFPSSLRGAAKGKLSSVPPCPRASGSCFASCPVPPAPDPSPGAAVKPQPAPWMLSGIFLPISLYPCLPQLSCPALTHISLPSSSPAGHQKKGLLQVKRLERPQKSCGFLEQQEVD